MWRTRSEIPAVPLSWGLAPFRPVTLRLEPFGKSCLYQNSLLLRAFTPGIDPSCRTSFAGFVARRSILKSSVLRHASRFDSLGTRWSCEPDEADQRSENGNQRYRKPVGIRRGDAKPVNRESTTAPHLKTRSVRVESRPLDAVIRQPGGRTPRWAGPRSGQRVGEASDRYGLPHHPSGESTSSSLHGTIDPGIDLPLGQRNQPFQGEGAIHILR